MDGLIGLLSGIFIGSMFGFFLAALLMTVSDTERLQEETEGMNGGMTDGKDDER